MTDQPESFAFLNVAAIPEPEAHALILASLGAIGFTQQPPPPDLIVVPTHRPRGIGADVVFGRYSIPSNS